MREAGVLETGSTALHLVIDWQACDQQHVIVT